VAYRETELPQVGVAQFGHGKCVSRLARKRIAVLPGFEHVQPFVDGVCLGSS
jgi:hypothetical protein